MRMALLTWAPFHLGTLKQRLNPLMFAAYNRVLTTARTTIQVGT